MRTTIITLILSLACLPVLAGTNLSYQGRLDASGTPFTGTVAMQFQLYDSETGGNPVGPELTRSSVDVTDGLFQVNLDFGAAFAGPRWLEITVDGSTLSSRQRVSPAPTAIRAETLDGLDSTAFQQAFERTLVVSPTGNAAADGTALVNAVDGVNDASTSSPVLVFVEPGTYTLDQPLEIPADVYLRGAGRGATRITRTGDIDTFSFDGIRMTAPSALTDLSVLVFGGGSNRAEAIDIDGSGEIRISRALIRVQGANELNYGVSASTSGSASLRISDATIETQGGSRARGILASGGMGLFVRDSTIVATGASSVMNGVMARGTPESRLVDSRIDSGEDGLYSDNGLLTVRGSEVFGQNTGASGNLAIFDSRIEAANNRVISAVSGVPVPEAANSQLIGPTGQGSCVAVYDGNFNFFAESCPAHW